MIRRSALILAIAGCGRFSVEAPTILDAGDDGSAASDAGADANEDGATEPPIDAGPPVLSVAYSFETDAYSDSIRAVAATGEQVYFYNRDERSISALGNPSPVFPNVSDSNEFTIRDGHIWWAPGKLLRFDLGKASYDLGTGHVDGCIAVNTSKTIVFASDSAGRIISVPYDNAGETEVLTGLNLPWGVAATDSRIFFTRAKNTIVARPWPNPGASPDAWTLEDLSNPQCLTVDGDFIYFPTYDDGKIHRVRLDGTEHIVIKEGQMHPTQIAIAGGALYWNSGTKVMRLGPR